MWPPRTAVRSLRAFRGDITHWFIAHHVFTRCAWYALFAASSALLNWPSTSCALEPWPPSCFRSADGTVYVRCSTTSITRPYWSLLLRRTAVAGDTRTFLSGRRQALVQATHARPKGPSASAPGAEKSSRSTALGLVGATAGCVPPSWNGSPLWCACGDPSPSTPLRSPVVTMASSSGNPRPSEVSLNANS